MRPFFVQALGRSLEDVQPRARQMLKQQFDPGSVRTKIQANQAYNLASSASSPQQITPDHPERISNYVAWSGGSFCTITKYEKKNDAK